MEKVCSNSTKQIVVPDFKNKQNYFSPKASQKPTGRGKIYLYSNDEHGFIIYSITSWFNLLTPKTFY